MKTIELAHVLRLEHARQRFRRLGDRAVEQDRRRHLARTDHARADAVLAFLEIDGVAHGHHAVLGGRVGGPRHRPDPSPGPRCGVDQLPALLRAHDRQHRLGDVEGAREIGLDDLVDALGLQALPIAVGDVRAGVVDEDVEAPELGADVLGDVAHGGGIRHVRRARKRLAAALGDALGHRLERLLAPSGENHRRALARQRHRRGLTDAAARARHPRDLAFEADHEIFPVTGPTTSSCGS